MDHGQTNTVGRQRHKYTHNTNRKTNGNTKDIADHGQTNTVGPAARQIMRRATRRNYCLHTSAVSPNTIVRTNTNTNTNTN